MIHVLALILLTQTSIPEVEPLDCFRDLLNAGIQQHLVSTVEKVLDNTSTDEEIVIGFLDTFIASYQSNDQKAKLIVQLMFNQINHKDYYAKYIQGGRGEDVGAIIRILMQKVNPPVYDTALAIYPIMDCANEKFNTSCRKMIHGIAKPNNGSAQDMNPLFAVLDLKYKENPEVDWSPNFIKACWWLHPAKSILYVLYKYPQYKEIINEFCLPEKYVDSDEFISGKTLTLKKEFTPEIIEKLDMLQTSEKFIDNFVAVGLQLIFFADKGEEIQKDLVTSQLELYMYMKGTMSQE